MEPDHAGDRRGPSDFALIVALIIALTMPLSEFTIVEANLRAAMRFFGEATGTGEVRDLGGAVGIYSGLDYGGFHIAMLCGPVQVPAREPERQLAVVRRVF